MADSSRFPQGLVASRDHAAAFEHQDHDPAHRVREVHHAARHEHGLAGMEIDGMGLELDLQIAFEHEEELILLFVLVPMKIPVQHPQPHYAIVHADQSLIPPRLMRGAEGGDIDGFQGFEGDVEIDIVGLGHCCGFT